MTKLLAIVSISLALTAVACKKDGAAPTEGAKATEGAAAPAAAPAKPQPPIELTETANLGAAIKDPDDKSLAGIKAKTPKGAVVEAGMTGVTITLGKGGFELSKAFEPGTVAKVKDEAKASTLDKLVKFHVDSPDAILWESSSELGGENNFNFAAEVKVGADLYKCKSEGYGQHSKVEAEALLKSCQSITK
jgi:hypothetical protein